jgi:2,3,4,5-tetrahydropyridine-2-carboxylate N-succinyltransferase
MTETETLIDRAFDRFDSLTESERLLLSTEVERRFDALDRGTEQVVRITAQGPRHSEELKKAILLYFRLNGSKVIPGSFTTYFDKVPVKTWTGDESVRVVPPAVVRRSAFVEAGAILMPCYINVGARVGAGSMIDTWATVGSCAYVGRNVHISGGVGLGGVLEPVQARPVVIEDDAFIGSRCILVEGVHIGKGAVLGAGVTITGSTKIIDVTQDKPVVHTGSVPENSVVIPGTMPKAFRGGEFGVPCALIIGQRKPSTNLKTSLNEALRDFGVAT